MCLLEMLLSSSVNRLIDDIRTEFHPYSGKPVLIQPFEEFGFENRSDVQVPEDFEPWKPFHTRFDFEVSEFALRAGRNNELTNDLLHLLNKSHSNNLTIKNTAEMQKLWELAAFKTPQFQKEEFSVEYQGEDQTFSVLLRPLWDWVEEIATDKDLAPKMQWDACRHCKFDGEDWERFIEEPWTADCWWSIQSALPVDGKPFSIILYSDKNKLSSFGTQKGYPVIARCANLPSHIRNGNGKGGGRIVGWLPVVTYSKIIESIVAYSETGNALDCGDNVPRTLFPIPFIMSADYEEQCMIALIRGFMGLCPCPKCLVPKEQLSNLTLKPQLRTQHSTERLMTQVRSQSRQDAKEEILKKYGLRPVENTFFQLAHMDPYAACSFDELHFDSSRLWGNHLFEQFKAHLTVAGRDAAVKINTKFEKMPSWRNLTHHKSVTNLSFNDGSKHRDISKVDTEIEKSWNFPKMHYHVHQFDDIQNKGVQSYYLWGVFLISEKMHGNLRNIYHQRINFKNVPEQFLVADITYSQVDSLDEYMQSKVEEDELAEDSIGGHHFSLGSKCKPLTFEELEDLHKSEQSYSRFRIRLGQFMTGFLPANNIPLPNGKEVRYSSSDMITPFQFLKINYESMESWRIETDYLRCNPSFHMRNRARFDYVLFKRTEVDFRFAQIIQLFTCHAHGNIYAVGFVQPYKIIYKIATHVALAKFTMEGIFDGHN
ncbi:hypothetical protein K435DRAFT_819621 [Dendrothele bispora CBS 962.96]|uniref:Uncharacterized protein n=1 Tax=Dendrothele bispora (strain CBS 962.96) TaxID=1314807 RepID=A0A4V4HFP7_DENBC|nr:hypothetical protein K435DRAFT_819621 [Dendrothele bispora CBS 962.96]